MDNVTRTIFDNAFRSSGLLTFMIKSGAMEYWDDPLFNEVRFRKPHEDMPLKEHYHQIDLVARAFKGFMIESLVGTLESMDCETIKWSGRLRHAKMCYIAPWTVLDKISDSLSPGPDYEYPGTLFYNLIPCYHVYQPISAAYALNSIGLRLHMGDDSASFQWIEHPLATVRYRI